MRGRLKQSNVPSNKRGIATKVNPSLHKGTSCEMSMATELMSITDTTSQSNDSTKEQAVDVT